MLQEIFNNFFSTSEFIPHGHCYLWNTNLVLLHILGDILITIAYYSIPIILVYFIWKRRDVPFDWIFLMFSSFIVACGTTHLMSIVTLWYPIYWLSGLFKAITAVISIYAAFSLLSLIPQALALPSPAQLEVANIALQNEITRREQVELALRESQQMLHLVIDNIPQYIFWKDQQSVFLGCNRKFAEMVGVSSPENIVGKTELDLAWKQEEADFFREYDCQYMDTKNAEYNIVKRLIIPDKKAIWLETNKIPLYDSTGNIVGILGTFEDITERRQAEEDIYYALEKEKELIELKSRFISVASHEFRTPLTIILSSAEILKNYSHKLSEEKKEQHLQRIKASVVNMVQLLDDVLLMSKAEAGRIEFNPIPIGIVKFCSDLVEELQISSGKRIIFSNEGENKIVLMDEKLLRQILNNLISNAIKYSYQDSNVHFNLVFEPGEVIFQIQDQGIGIPATEQAQLFTPFYRGSNVSTVSGTGLGLSIVKKAIDLHGGRITVESEISVGTKVIVVIPLR